MQVTHFLNSIRPEHDGVTRVADHLRAGFLKAPQSSSHQFLASVLPDPIPNDMRRVPSIPFPLSTGYRFPVWYKRVVLSALQNQKNPILHIHTPCPLGLTAARLAEKRKLPCVATYHTHFPTYLKYYKITALRSWVWRYLKHLYRSCDHLIVPSQATLEELKNEGFSRLIHIPHGVDTHLYSPSQRKNSWRKKVGGENRVIVTFVGRLVWEKNLKLLPEIAQRVSHPHQVQWVVVGDGPARAQLEKLLPQAYFTGFLGSTELPTAYASSDVFIFPSVTETFGNVTVEAMASGLPALCVAAGGARDLIIPGENGFLLDPNDPLEFAKAIDLLVSKPDLRAQLSEGALRRSARYSWKSTVEQYLSVYESLLRDQRK